MLCTKDEELAEGFHWPVNQKDLKQLPTNFKFIIVLNKSTHKHELAFLMLVLL